MPRTCTICAHGERAAIDSALASGTPNRRIATHYGLSEASVRRHAREHVAQAVAASQAAKSEGAALDVVRQLKAINATTQAIVKEARDGGDNDLALKAIDRVQRQLELQAKLLGDLDERPVTQVAIIQSPDWQRLRSVILAALAPFPDARLAVASALAAEVTS